MPAESEGVDSGKEYLKIREMMLHAHCRDQEKRIIEQTLEKS